MKAGAVLSKDELRFIESVVGRRFGQDSAETGGLSVAEPAKDAFHRAAAAAMTLLEAGGGASLAKPAALVAMCCQLEADGYTLLAPQGAAAGMVSGLAAGRVDAGSLVRWLEDRAVQTGSLPT